MITLNDYLYSGDTVLKILQRYHNDLKEDAKKTQNGMDMIHCNFLLQLMELLEHNDFLTSQSQRLREFYKYMSSEYPFLAFTFKGRIKSLIRAEQKFNGNIVEHVYDYYEKNTSFPSITELKQQIGPIRDLIAYRIVISMPVCHLKDGEKREEIERLEGKGYQVTEGEVDFIVAWSPKGENQEYAVCLATLYLKSLVSDKKESNH